MSAQGYETKQEGNRETKYISSIPMTLVSFFSFSVQRCVCSLFLAQGSPAIHNAGLLNEQTFAVLLYCHPLQIEVFAI